MGATRLQQISGTNRTPSLFKRKLVFQHKFSCNKFLCKKLTVMRKVVENKMVEGSERLTGRCVGCWS